MSILTCIRDMCNVGWTSAHVHSELAGYYRRFVSSSLHKDIAACYNTAWRCPLVEAIAAVSSLP